MRFRDLLRLAWGNLWRIKVRTILTVGGVLIGITFMVIMVSIGIGLERTVTDELSGSVQLNQVTVHGGSGGYYGPVIIEEEAGQGQKVLNQRALQEITKINGVTALTPVVHVPVNEIRLRRDLIWVSILGMDLQQLKHFGFALDDGSPIPRGGNVALAGYRVPEEAARGERYFYMEEPGEEDLERVELTNRRLEIICQRGPDWNKEQAIYNDALAEERLEEEKLYRVRVAGVLEELSSWEDYNLILPLDMAEEICEWFFHERSYFQKNGYDEVKVFVADTGEVNRVAGEIKEMGLFAFSFKEMIESTTTVFKVLQFVMGGIGCVALLIAAVGIANTLIMSIYERTKEIGIIKVVGASLPDIRNLFLLEAGFIGFMGGIIGVLCGWLGGLLLNLAASSYLSQSGAGEIKLVCLPLSVAIFTVFFSAIVGLAAGLYPAIRAANLSAIEAIRYE